VHVAMMHTGSAMARISRFSGSNRAAGQAACTCGACLQLLRVTDFRGEHSHVQHTDVVTLSAKLTDLHAHVVDVKQQIRVVAAAQAAAPAQAVAAAAQAVAAAQAAVGSAAPAQAHMASGAYTPKLELLHETRLT
jgi:hypothetical protein